jgi:hypothetical protein
MDFAQIVLHGGVHFEFLGENSQDPAANVISVHAERFLL